MNIYVIYIFLPNRYILYISVQTYTKDVLGHFYAHISKDSK